MESGNYVPLFNDDHTVPCLLRIFGSDFMHDLYVMVFELRGVIFLLKWSPLENNSTSDEVFRHLGAREHLREICAPRNHPRLSLATSLFTRTVFVINTILPAWPCRRFSHSGSLIQHFRRKVCRDTFQPVTSSDVYQTNRCSFPNADVNPAVRSIAS